jgi:hypothetical protein
MSMMGQMMRFAKSRQGRQMLMQAKRYATSPEGRAKIEQARRQIASRRKPKGGVGEPERR